MFRPGTISSLFSIVYDTVMGVPVCRRTFGTINSKGELFFSSNLSQHFVMLHIRPPGIHATVGEREAWIERVRRDSQTLDSIAKVLDHIRESVADVLQSAQETISRQLAFPLVPDEVLIRILSYAVKCDSSTDTAKELNRVGQT